MQEKDLIIIGAGPAGMSAACAAKKLGLDVCVLDEQPSPGGQIFRHITQASQLIKTILGPEYVKGESLAQDFLKSGVDYRPKTSVWHIADDLSVGIVANGEADYIRGKKILIANGAYERPFPIPGWTLPGVMTAGGAQTLLKNAALAPKQDCVFVGCGPLLYLLANQYIQAGIKIAAIIDTAPTVEPRQGLKHLAGLFYGREFIRRGLKYIKAIKNSHIPWYQGCSDIELHGEQTLTSIRFTAGGKMHQIDCRLAFLHQGVIPNTQLTFEIRARHTWDKVQHCWLPTVDENMQTSVANVYVAGDGANIGGAEGAILQGTLVGSLIARSLDTKLPTDTEQQLNKLRLDLKKLYAFREFIFSCYTPTQAFRIPKDDTIVCRCEEVTAGDIRHQVDRGCNGPNQLKSFTRCGMGPCQGRECGLTVSEIIQEKTQLPIEKVGHYRIRPPIKPLTLGQLAHVKKYEK